VVVLDPTLLGVVDVTSGLKDGGLLIINTAMSADEARTRYDSRWRLATVDATRIAREELGVPIVNTTMLGALIRATGVVALESLLVPLQERFERLAERNISAMKRAYNETVIKEIS